MTQISVDAKTKEIVSRKYEVPEAAIVGAVAMHNEAIKAELQDNELKALRALFEGDQARIAAHLKTQAELRAKLK